MKGILCDWDLLSQQVFPRSEPAILVSGVPFNT